MTEGSLERVLRRDRAIVLAALLAVLVLAWIYLASSGAHWMADDPAHSAGAMTGMDAASSAELPNGAPELGAHFAPWSAADFLLMFLMWAVMMVGMMTPSVAPMLLIYARVARHSDRGARPFAPVGWFAGGYLLAWFGFAALATSLQWLLEQAALLTPSMAAADRILGGILLIGAGIYQWTPLKEACLGQCRSPFRFIQSNGGFRGDPGGSVLLGLRHGAFCIGCCWALMLLLFLGGVMNLLWIAFLAATVLAEKVLPAGRHLARAIGAAFILAGLGLSTGIW